MPPRQSSGAQQGSVSSGNLPNAQEWEVLQEVARIITSTLDIDEVYEKFASQVQKLVEADRININVIDHVAGTTTNKYHFGRDVAEYPVGYTLPLKGTTSEQVITTGKCLVYDDENLEFQYEY